MSPLTLKKTVATSCLKRKPIKYNQFYVITEHFGGTSSMGTVFFLTYVHSKNSGIYLNWKLQLSPNHLTFFKKLTFDKKKEEQLRTIQNVKLKT